MSEELARMLDMKTTDWLNACKEIERLEAKNALLRRALEEIIKLFKVDGITYSQVVARIIVTAKEALNP